MVRKTLWILLSVLLVVALALPSCGGKAGEQTTATTAADTPIYGGTLTPAFEVQNWSGGPQSWDMVKWTWMGHAYASFAMDGLQMADFTRGPSGTKEFEFSSTDFIPDASTTGALATSYEFSTPTLVRFNLRQGVKWQNKSPTNGRALTADDVVWAMTRTIGFETGKGRWPRHNFVKAVRKVNETTIEIEFTAPQAFWGYEMAWGPYFLIYPKESVDAEGGLDNWKNVAGTGPFIVQDYVSDAQVTYVKNPDWWGTWTYKGKTYKLPFLDKIVIPIMPDQSARIAAFRTGKLDIYQMAGMTTKKDILTQGPELEKIISSVQVMRGGGTQLLFNTLEPPFDNIKVRRAMNMAIDRQAVINAFYEGIGDIFYFPLQKSDGLTLFTPLEKAPPDLQEIFIYNPTKAKQLLAEAGYPNGFKTTLTIATGPTTADFSAMVQEFWKAIGVEVEVKIMEEATIQSLGFDRKYHGLISHGIQARPQVFNDLTCKHAYNFSGMCDDYFEAQWQKARTTVDVAARDALLKDLFIYYQNLVVAFCLPTGAEWTGWWPWVHNYNGEVSFGFHKHQYWAYSWIDEAKKKEMGY